MMLLITSDFYSSFGNENFNSASLSLFSDDRTAQHCTLSPARTLKEAMTWSAVSVSAVSRDMKSMKAWKVTRPIRLGSTMLIMRENSFSPWWQEKGTMNLRRSGDSPHNNTQQTTDGLTCFVHCLAQIYITLCLKLIGGTVVRKY